MFLASAGSRTARRAGRGCPSCPATRCSGCAAAVRRRGTNSSSSLRATGLMRSAGIDVVRGTARRSADRGSSALPESRRRAARRSGRRCSACCRACCGSPRSSRTRTACSSRSARRGCRRTGSASASAWPGRRREEVARLERVVAVELPGRAVHLVRCRLRVTTLTTEPALRPNSALYECVRILNSWIASGGGRSTKPVLNVSLLLAPSSRKLFDWLRMPLTLKPAVAAPNPPGVASPAAPPRPAGGAITPGMQRARAA